MKNIFTHSLALSILAASLASSPSFAAGDRGIISDRYTFLSLKCQGNVLSQKTCKIMWKDEAGRYFKKGQVVTAESKITKLTVKNNGKTYSVRVNYDEPIGKGKMKAGSFKVYPFKSIVVLAP